MKLKLKPKLSSSFWRYTAFQVPGWIIAAGGGWLLHRWLNIPLWVASGVLVVWVIKDYALYPLLGSAYELDHRRPIDRLVGEHGTASDALSPSGYIRVRGELWRARSEDVKVDVEVAEDVEGNIDVDVDVESKKAVVIVQGDRVEVIGVDGTLLVVRPITPPR